MKEFANKLYTGFCKIKVVIVVIVVCIYLGLVSFGGASGLEFFWFSIVVCAYIFLPGLLWAKLLRVEKVMKHYTVPFAILLGTGFFAMLYCFAMRLDLLMILRVLPPVMAVIWFITWGRKFSGNLKKGKLVKFTIKPEHWMSILLFSALLFFYTFTSVAKNGHPAIVGDVLLNQDFLWNVGNANSFKLGFPPQDIRFYDVRLHYHYLTELLAGALSIVSGVSSYNIIGFYMQPFMLAAMVICLYKFARIVWDKSLFKAIFFCYSLFLFSCASLWKALPNGQSVFGNSYITHLITNINGQTTATVFLCIFGGLLIKAMRKNYDVGIIHYVLMLASLFMLLFAKGPIAAIVVCGLVVVLIIGIFRKDVCWKGFVFGGLALAMFVVVYFTMFSSGANNSMTFSTYGTLEKNYFRNILMLINSKSEVASKIAIPIFVVLQSFFIVPAAFLLFVQQGVQSLRAFRKVPQERLFFNAVAIGGFLAYFLFDHPAMSQTYFLFAGIFCIYILAVGQIDTLHWPQKDEMTKKSLVRKRAWVSIVAFFAAVGLATTCFLYVNLVGSGIRQVAFNAGTLEKYDYDVVMAPDDEKAMIWFEKNTPQDSMFATNRIHTGARKEGISNLYSALSGRQGYMEGFQYAVTNMGVSENIVQNRIAVNNALFSAGSTPQEIKQLCAENGIDYLIFSPQFDGDEQQLESFPCVYNSAMVRIYQVNNEVGK